MPGRKYNSAEYRYGFNGKEKDESGEFGNLTNYDYGFRIYNPAIGRFLSVDPLTAQYPALTAYQFASNTPIMGNDLDGLEVNYVFFGDDGGKTVIGTENYFTIETTPSGLDNFKGVTTPIVNGYGVIEVNANEGFNRILESQTKINLQKARARDANHVLARHKARSSNFLATLYDVSPLADGVAAAKFANAGEYKSAALVVFFTLVPGKVDDALRKVSIQVGEATGTLQRTKRGFDGSVTYNGKKVDFDATVSGTKDDLVIDDIGIFIENKVGTDYLGSEGKNALGRNFSTDLRRGVESQLQKEGVTKVTYKYQRVLYDKKTGKKTGKTEEKSTTRAYENGSWKTQTN